MNAFDPLQRTDVTEDFRPGGKWTRRARRRRHGMADEVRRRLQEERSVEIEHVLGHTDQVRYGASPPDQALRADPTKQPARPARFSVSAGQRHARAEKVVVVEGVDDRQSESPAVLP